MQPVFVQLETVEKGIEAEQAIHCQKKLNSVNNPLFRHTIPITKNYLKFSLTRALHDRLCASRSTRRLCLYYLLYTGSKWHLRAALKCLQKFVYFLGHSLLVLSAQTFLFTLREVLFFSPPKCTLDISRNAFFGSRTMSYYNSTTGAAHIIPSETLIISPRKELSAGAPFTRARKGTKLRRFRLLRGRAHTRLS